MKDAAKRSKSPNLLLPGDHATVVPSIIEVTIPDYLVETTRDFGSLDESVFDVKSITDSLSMQFGGLECSGLKPPRPTLESNVTNAYHMGNSHMVSMNESKVISDFERVVKDRLVLFKKEITCENMRHLRGKSIWS